MAESFKRINYQTTHQKTLLLIGNCSALCDYESLPSLSRIAFMSFLLSSENKIQPLDAGIIATLKKGYWHRHLERAIGLAAVKINDIKLTSVPPWSGFVRYDLKSRRKRLPIVGGQPGS